eukprot:gb/GEZN01000829.1/.p1 GENE.gb/GEZN01000829.1/~~gb/GEZN01000829.1/.p1  ORF type:complete len:1062 (+),score=199.70 gb/GEZN01000829.1/:200-3385(+)
MSAAALAEKEKGNAAFKRGDMVEACEHYTFASEMDPSNHVLFTNRAAAYAQMEKWDKSLRDSEKAIKLKSGWSKGYWLRGNALMALNRVEEAVASYAMAQQLEPANAKYKQLHADAEKKFLGMGAVKKFRKDNKQEGPPPSTSAAVLAAKAKGNAAFKLGDMAAAIEHYTIASEMDPSNHVLFTNRSAAYAQIKEWDKSLRDAEKAISLKSDWSKGHWRRGNALMELNRVKEAIDAYVVAMQLEPATKTYKKSYADAKKMSSGKVPRLGVSVQYLLAFSETHLQAGSLLPSHTSKDVVENLIKPQTLATKTSFVDQLSASNVGQAQFVRVATVFLSHAWSYKFLDVVDAVRLHWPSPEEQSTVFLWFDIFTVNQHATDTVPGQFWFDAFRTNVKKIGHTVLVQSPWANPVPLTRAWCLWEIHCTADVQAEFEIILSSAEEKSFLQALVTEEGIAQINTMLATVDVSVAKAWKLQDQEKILKAVRDSEGGVHGLNKLVIRQLRDWLATTAQASVLKEEATCKDKISSPLMNSVGLLLREQGKLSEAERMFRCALKRYEEDQNSVKMMKEQIENCLAMVNEHGIVRSMPELLFRAQAGRETKFRESQQEKKLAMMNNLAGVLYNQGKISEAEPLFRCVLEGYEAKFGATDPRILKAVNNLSHLLKAQGKWTEAELLTRRSLEGREKAFGTTHPNTLVVVSNLASLLHSQGKLREAEPLYRRALQGFEAQYGESHPDTLLAVDNLATFLQAQGKLNDAELLYRRALEGREAKLGEMHPDTLITVNNLATLLNDQGKLSEAEPLYRRALEGMKAKLGATHPTTQGMANNLATLLKVQSTLSEANLGSACPDTDTDTLNFIVEDLYRQGKFSEAERFSRLVLKRKEASLGATHPDTLLSMNNLAMLLKTQGKFSEAEPLYRRALEGSETNLGVTHADTLLSMNNLAALLKAQGRLSEAEPLYRRALEGSEATLGATHPHTLTTMHNLAAALKAQDKLSEAEPLYRRALEGKEARHGMTHPDTLVTVHNLAMLLCAQGKLSEAEPLFRRAGIPSPNHSLLQRGNRLL